MIEAFPEEAFFNYSLGGMRPFAALAKEMIGMAGPSMVGVATRDLLYFIDNEVHHRGQGYVYLRALGINPPPL